MKDNKEMAKNCAWCGDGPDEFGSHGICETHKKAMLLQSAARRAARAAQEAKTCDAMLREQERMAATPSRRWKLFFANVSKAFAG